MRPSVSVIIPAYRAAKTIGRAVDSALAQTRPPDEVLIIDDGSPDDLAGVLAPYRHALTIIRQPNTGAAGARNRGIDAAQGDLIAFLDADDYWAPTKLQCQLDAFDRHPQVGFVGSRYSVQSPGAAPSPPPPDDESFYDRVLVASPGRILDTLLRFCTPTIVVRRESLRQHRFDTRLKVAEDLDLWVRLLAEHPVYILSQPLTTVVLEVASLSRSDPDQGYSPMIDVARRYGHLVGSDALRKFEARVYRGWASAHLGRGHPYAALRPASRRLCLQPFSLEAWWILGKCTALSCVERCRSSHPSKTNTLQQAAVPERASS